MSNISYRPDIDGLRAVAVLSVIICHANAAWLPGGFVGVDIFFVISGFLITSIIHREIEAGNFSYQAFYQRRIKRILPAFFVVLLLVLLAGSLILSADEMQSLGKSSRYATFFASNFYFSGTMDYFAPDLKEMPLLHTWSLAVEEQFYFVWPVLLMFLVRFGRERLLAASLLLCVASFVFASIFARNPETAIWNYYHLPSRMGELLLGSMLAIHRPAVRFAGLASTLGLGLIAGSFLLLDENSVFPGYNALWPCLGAVLLIYAGGGSSQPWVSRLLAWRPMVFVGLLSYSLYLWHWPILAYVRYVTMTVELSNLSIALSLLLSLVLSWLTWRWVEQPVRAQKLSFKTVFVRYFAVPALLMLVAALCIKKTGGYLWHGEDRKMVKIATEEHGCLKVLAPSCTVGADGVKPATLIYGDSHAKHFSVVFDRLGKQQGWSADFFAVYGCHFIEGNDAGLDYPEDCRRMTKHVRSVLDDYGNVVIALRWYRYLKLGEPSKQAEAELFRQQFTDVIASLAASGKQVFLVAQIPEFAQDPLRAFKVYQRNPFKVYEPGAIGLEYVNYQTANLWVSQLAGRYDNVHYLDFVPLILQWPEGIVNRVPMYMDTNHLNQYGQEQLFQEISAAGSYQWFGDALKGQGEPVQ